MYEYDKKSFAQILSELRRTAGLSQRKAAADRPHDLPAPTRALLAVLRTHINAITADLDSHFESLSRLPDLKDWLSSQELLHYWQAMSYGLGPREQASLALFGEHCTSRGLLPGMPGLRWFKD